MRNEGGARGRGGRSPLASRERGEGSGARGGAVLSTDLGNELNEFPLARRNSFNLLQNSLTAQAPSPAPMSRSNRDRFARPPRVHGWSGPSVCSRIAIARSY